MRKYHGGRGSGHHSFRKWTSLHRNTLRNDYYDCSKLVTGPCGLYCPCCGYPFHISPRRAKPKIRRYARHVHKQKLREQLRNNYNE